MKIKDFLSDIKTWVLLVVFFIGIGTAFSQVITLPKKVEEIDKKSRVTDNSVQQLASNLDKYIARQEILREEQDKREQLMLEIIRKKR